MGAAPSRASLLRLLLGAAFLLFGFFLASTTAARADDSGLLGTVDAVTTVEQVVDTRVDVVDSAPARSAVPAPVTDVVAASADLVEEVAAAPATVVKPVRTVTETVAEPVVKTVVEPVAEPVVKAVVKPVVTSVSEPVQAVTTTVRTTTAATTTLVTASVVTVTETVEPVVAPVTTAVLPPVTDVVDPVVSPVHPVGTVIDPETDGVPAVSDVPAPLVEVRDEAATPAAAQSFVKPEQMRSVVPTADAALSALARDGRNPRTLSQRDLTLTGASPVVVSAAPDRAPSTPAPRPAGPHPGAVPGSGSSGASSPGGTDVATTTSALSLPESSSAAPTSSTSRFTPGPAMDPGSRPD